MQPSVPLSTMVHGGEAYTRRGGRTAEAPPPPEHAATPLRLPEGGGSGVVSGAVMLSTNVEPEANPAPVTVSASPPRVESSASPAGVSTLASDTAVPLPLPALLRDTHTLTLKGTVYGGAFVSVTVAYTGNTPRHWYPPRMLTPAPMLSGTSEDRFPDRGSRAKHGEDAGSSAKCSVSPLGFSWSSSDADTRPRGTVPPAASAACGTTSSCGDCATGGSFTSSRLMVTSTVEYRDGTTASRTRTMSR